jgi:hypothetical protein
LQQSLEEEAPAFVSRFKATPKLAEIAWRRDASLPDKIVYDADITGFEGLLPRYNDSPADQVAVMALRMEAEATLNQLIHLTSIRAPLLGVYENRPPGNYLRPTGDEAPYLLNESPRLLEAVSDWYATNLDVKGLSVQAEAAAFRMTVGSSRSDHNLARAGQGIQQVLPVVTYLKAMVADVIDAGTMVVEEPELHLHPSAHGALADLAVDAVKARPTAQVIIETHSENLLLRLRRRVATGELSPDDVNFVWFDQVGGGTQIKEILIRRDGTVTDWPSGVFAEDLDEVRAIARAAPR